MKNLLQLLNPDASEAPRPTEEAAAEPHPSPDPRPPASCSSLPSEARAQAARANGARSQGPRTAKGKARSAQNARRHGLLARQVVLPNENPRYFKALLKSFEESLQPATPPAAALVENMAVARWRQMRLWAVENANLRHEIQLQSPAITPDPGLQVGLAFRTLSDASQTLHLLHRYETAFDRQYNRSLQALLKLQPAASEAMRPNPQAAAEPQLSPDPRPPIPCLLPPTSDPLLEAA